ncbi:MAG TPA: efflux RND transporter periplasmic adaptor subunit [Chitinophagaceae bacterium]|nr:efflux RND transporter periplasmic adaptor subunit [Chitinophagaceae bacterium]
MIKRMLLMGGLAALLCQTACRSEKEEEVETKYLATSPLKTDTTLVKNYVCQISSIRHIELRTQERGYLEKIYVDEGQFVKKGQLLFQIMPTLYNAEIQKAGAEVSFAEIEYRNTKGLADSNVVAPNELAMSKAKLNKAKAELALAQVHRDFTEIRAPFDGIVGRFQTKLGSLVDEGELLSTLSDNSLMWVYFNVPEAEYLNFKTNAAKENLSTVNLLMANNQLFDTSGVVETIEADFNNENGNIAFRATFPNKRSLLRNGETGNIQMTIPVKNALLIPQKATFEVLEKKYVFVVDKNNVAHQKEVTIGGEMPDLYIVKDGLTENDRLIIEGIRKVKNNEKIKFDYEAPRKVFANLKVAVE